MIRLSEGLAKLYGSQEVLIRHVTEAAYLLKTSIVHIEQEAVSLEDDDERVMRASEAGEMDLDDEQVVNVESAKKEQIVLTAEEYQKIVQSIILKLTKEERETKIAGMKKSSVIQWYMESLEAADAIEDEESLIRQRKIVKSVIKRMVRQEQALLEMRDTTRLGDEDEQDVDEEDPVLVINPAYSPVE
jgi:DNA replication licensing factor MCM6